jgi:outer membrane biosynthesis protein TonB
VCDLPDPEAVSGQDVASCAIMSAMTDEEHSQVLGALPRTRPHRRSDKRGARPAAQEEQVAETKTAAAKPTPAKPNGTTPAKPTPAKPNGTPLEKPKRAKTSPKAEQRPANAKAKAAAATPRERPRTTRREPTGATRLKQPAQPEGTPEARRGRQPAPSSGPDILGTAVQAVAELAEIGLSASARAIRRAVARLPRP